MNRTNDNPGGGDAEAKGHVSFPAERRPSIEIADSSQAAASALIGRGAP
jgi:hypothetical protein